MGAWFRRVLLSLAVGGVAVSAQTPGPPPAAALAGRLIQTTDPAARQEILESAALDLAVYEALREQSNRLAASRQFEDALRGYDVAHQVADRIGHQRGVAASLSGIGTIHGRRGDYAQAVRFLRDGLAISEALRDVPNIEVAVNNLGIVYRLQGEYEEALAYYERALELSGMLEDRSGIPRTLNNIGIVHMLRGSYRQALEFYRRSLQLKEAGGHTADVPSTLDNIGRVYELIGDADLALDYHERSVALNERLGNRAATASALGRIGRVHAGQGRFEIGLKHYERALALEEAAGRKAEIAATLYNIGVLHRAREQPAEALAYHDRGLAMRESINDRPGMAESLVEISRLRRRQGRLDDALEAAQRASRLAGETGSRETLWRARLAAGDASRALGRPQPARQAYEDAVETIEGLRADVAGGERERQRFLEDKLAPYHRLADLLIAEGRIVEALGVAERAKARVILDTTKAGRFETRVLTLAERERERQLEQEMSAALTKLLAETAKPQPDRASAEALSANLRRARLAHVEFRAALYERYPVLRRSRGDNVRESLDHVAAFVTSPATAVLEFMVGDAETYLFVVTADDLRCFKVDITLADLRARTQRFREQLAARDLDVQRTSRDLYARLLAPAAAVLRGKTDLVIVPDGVLWEVPFQALQAAPRRYLLEDAVISYAPSMAVLREMKSRGGTDRFVATPTLVALGDPRPPRDAASSVPAPTPFVPLPDAARQVRALARVYGARHSRILTGADATEERLRSSAGDATVLHLATHGWLDDSSPMYSFLSLSGEPTGGASRDGRLEAWEVMTLKLRADLVVLAACETARGRIGAGEGVVGLSWAFFLAGTPRTVVSLWKVDAASTTDLMVAFHRRLRGVRPDRSNASGAAAALRAAALSVMRDPQYRHPFYWAAFALVGDGS